MPQKKRKKKTIYEAIIIGHDDDDSAGLRNLTSGAPVSIEIGDAESTKLKLTGKVALNFRTETIKDTFAVMFKVQGDEQ